MRLFLDRRGACLLMVLVLVSCGSRESVESLTAKTRTAIEQYDYRQAAILAKSALQQNPDSAELRFLLGKSLLEGGDARGAEVELQRASDLKQAADDVEPLLMRAWLQQAQYDKIIEMAPKTRVLRADSRVEVGIALAAALYAKNRHAEAKAAITQALSNDPDHANGRLVLARIKVNEGDDAGALALVDAVIAKSPKSVEAYIMRGNLIGARGDSAASAAAFRKAIEIEPRGVTARVSIMVPLLATGQFEEAGKHLAELQKLAPRNPGVAFAEGMLSFATGNFKRAREAMLVALNVRTPGAHVLQLAGAIDYRLGNYVEAEANLAKAVAEAPDNLAYRRWHAMTLVAMGDPVRAAKVLAPVLEKAGDDPVILTLAGEIAVQAGDFKRGEDLLQRAVRLDPKDAARRTTLAKVRLDKGEFDAAIIDLSRISSEDKGTVADVALFASYLRRGDTEKALRVLDTIEKKTPKDPVPYNLRGGIYADRRDFPNARRNFEAALKLNPAFFPAAAALAGLDMAENKAADALKRFESVVAADPKSIKAMLALAQMKARLKAPSSEVLDWINKAIAAQPGDPSPRVALVGHYMDLGDAKQAIAAAQTAVGAFPDNPELLDVLGQAHEAVGDRNQALATFAKLARLQPKSPLPYTRMAQVQMKLKDNEGASSSLRKALAAKPDALMAQLALIQLDVEAGRLQDAVATARRIQTQRASEATGYVIEGDVFAKLQKWDQAVEAYRSGLKRLPSSTELALNLHAALGSGGKAAESDRFASDWIRDHPRDGAFRFRMGDLASRRGDFATALAHYRVVETIFRASPALFNNMASAMSRTGDPKALEYAEKAVALAPDEPAFVDTLAGVLMEKGDVNRAVELLSKATAKSDNPSIRLNYARALLRAAKKPEALRELDQLAKLGGKFAEQAEVSRLRAEAQ